MQIKKRKSDFEKMGKHIIHKKQKQQWKHLNKSASVPSHSLNTLIYNEYNFVKCELSYHKFHLF